MTYCVGVILESGLVLASDSRTNAGVDQIGTFRKMTVYERPGDRVLVMLSSGNLAVTQAVVGLLEQRKNENQENLWNTGSLYQAAYLVGEALREVQKRDGPYLTRIILTRAPPLFSAVKSAERDTGCSTSTRKEISLKRRRTRRFSRTENSNTGSPSSTA